jgi:hypothetical protein
MLNSANPSLINSATSTPIFTTAASRLSKHKAPSKPKEADKLTHAALQKDVHNWLVNLIKTIDAAEQPPPTLTPPTARLPGLRLKSAASDIRYQVIGPLTNTKPANFDTTKEDLMNANTEYQDSKSFHHHSSIDVWGKIMHVHLIS